MKRAATIILMVLIFLAPGALWAASLKGKLKVPAKKGSPAQYKILALSKGGAARLSQVSAKGNFSVTVKKGSTLHLIDSYNRYFGPVVAANSSRAYASSSGKSGSLGTADVKNGFAVVPFGKSRNLFSGQTVSFSKSKGPRGAGKLGLVRKTSKQFLNAAGEEAGDIADDIDSDGIPSAVDIDDDGDMILDVSDSGFGPSADYEASITSTLRVAFRNSINANAGGVTEDNINNALKEGLILGFRFASKKAAANSLNIDCGSLPYCAAGTGTAVIRSDNLQNEGREGTPWVNYDPDGDGLPNMVTGAGLSYIGIRPRASRSDLRPGDTIYFKAGTSSGPVTIPSVLPFYFLTGPALKEITSGGITEVITYPVSESSNGTGPEHPIQLNAGSVTFTLWRPQRPGVAGAEAAEYMDMGNLSYGVHVAISETGQVLSCEAADYSVTEGGTLVPDTQSGIGKLKDLSNDAAASPASTISYTLDLAACISRSGLSTAGRKVMLNLVAQTARMDQTSQDVYFRLPG